jgi:outer membrane protein, multidrug efflux system
MKKQLRQLVIGIVIVSLLAGCMVGPKYRRPVAESPSVFRGDGDRAAGIDPSSLADLKWFEVFKDEQLQELIRTALANNYDLRQAVARVQAARASLGITRWEQFPNVTAGVDVTTLRNSSSGQFALPAGFSRDRTFGTVVLNLLSFELDI